MTVIRHVLDKKIIMFLIAITTLFVAVSADSTQVLSVAKPEHPVNYTEFNHTVYANNVGVDELIKLNEIIRQQRALPFGGVIPRFSSTRRPKRHINESSYDRPAGYVDRPRSADEEFAIRMAAENRRSTNLPHQRYWAGLQRLNRTGTEFVEMFRRYQDSLFSMLCVSSSTDSPRYARMANSIETSIRHLNHIKSHLQEYMDFRPRNVDMCA